MQRMDQLNIKHIRHRTPTQRNIKHQQHLVCMKSYAPPLLQLCYNIFILFILFMIKKIKKGTEVPFFVTLKVTYLLISPVSTDSTT